MAEQAVSATEMRDNFSDYLEQVDRKRFVIAKHGKERAYLISVRELRALEETVQILENQELLQSIGRGLDDARKGRVRPSQEVFAELDAEFRSQD